MTRDDAQREAVYELWRKGRAADWLLDAGQQAWRTAFWGTPPLSSTVWNIGRQRGKTFDAVFIALEFGSMTEGIAEAFGRTFVKRAVIRYCAKTKESAVGIVKPAWDFLVETMPPEMRPVPGRTDYEWVFPHTGATFVLFGTDAQSFAKGRGPRTDLQLLDEVGFYQDLVSVESALLPSLQTTGGRALYLSTPAESVGHPYTQRIYAAMAAGRYQHDTFWSNPRVNHEGVIEAERTRLGMTRDEFLVCTFFRREYLAEILTDEGRAAFPAWTKALADELVGDWVRPAYFDAYQGHDPGKVGDPHASLFAYHDPAANLLVIESELELRSSAHSVGSWAAQVKARETELYGSTSWNGTLLGAPEWMEAFGEVPEYLRPSLSRTAPRQPFLRVGDDIGVCKDLTVDHQLAVIPSAKHEKALEVSNAGQLLRDKRVRIHRRCVRTIAQLYSTIWNKTRSSWERTELDHGDLAGDCFPFIVRNMLWHRDCRPKHVDSATRAIQAIQDRASGAKTWDDAFRRK